MRPIPGDPLTGQLPRTQLIVPQDVLGPVKERKVYIRDKDEWPRTADPQGYTIRQLRPGRVVSVRTRWGIRTWQVRVVNKSYEMRNKGRNFIVAMDRKGYCHSAWVDQIISVDTVQRALARGRTIDVRTTRV